VYQSTQIFLLPGSSNPVALAYKIFDLQISHGERIATLMNKYADLPMDLADASLVILAEHLGHGRILSVDQRDFNTYRWKNQHPFENLMVQR
jgi:predicted nucleic acid-binding protein